MIPDHPPPSYRDRDVDRFSLRSAAPSYTSSIPPRYTPRTTYTSLIPANTSSGSGLAPIPAHHAYNVVSWPSFSDQSQSRAYLNVAARRARRAQEEARSEMEADALGMMLRLGESTASIPEQPSSSPEQPSTSSSGQSSNSSSPEQPGSSSSLVVASPHLHLNMEEALRNESRSWDFFTAQAIGWEQREISWKAFKAKHASKKVKSKPRSWWGFYRRLG